MTLMVEKCNPKSFPTSLNPRSIWAELRQNPIDRNSGTSLWPDVALKLVQGQP